ncbi:MAG: hypothetical protein EAX86_03045 [Candidatus Heimdallarchaeota archaeon]|nr:hypothetical protein [Candidatus Heimdallarchaeota archaeon]
MSKYPKIKVYLITGFLGTGKTTLIQNLLPHFRSSIIGVLINEFGEIGIDSQLIPLNPPSLIEVIGGSIFCQCCREHFLQALFKFSTSAIEILLIETSGLSDPTPFLIDFQLVQEKTNEAFEYKGCICVVDTPRFLETHAALDVVNKQIISSEIVLINKIDLADIDTIERVKNQILNIKENLNIYKTTYCQILLDFLNQLEMSPITIINRDFSNSSVTTSHMDINLTSITLLNRNNLLSFLNAIAPKSRRIKGFVRLEDNYLYYVDCVDQEIKLEKKDLNIIESKIVVIFCEGIDITEISSVFDKWETLIASYSGRSGMSK